MNNSQDTFPTQQPKNKKGPILVLEEKIKHLEQEFTEVLIKFKEAEKSMEGVEYKLGEDGFGNVGIANVAPEKKETLVRAMNVANKKHEIEKALKKAQQELETEHKKQEEIKESKHQERRRNIASEIVREAAIAELDIRGCGKVLPKRPDNYMDRQDIFDRLTKEGFFEYVEPTIEYGIQLAEQIPDFLRERSGLLKVLKKNGLL